MAYLGEGPGQPGHLSPLYTTMLKCVVSLPSPEYVNVCFRPFFVELEILWLKTTTYLLYGNITHIIFIDMLGIKFGHYFTFFT